MCFKCFGLILGECWMFRVYLNVCECRLGRYFVVLMGVLDILRVFWVCLVSLGCCRVFWVCFKCFLCILYVSE